MKYLKMQKEKEINRIREWIVENPHVTPNHGDGSRKKENVYPRFYLIYYMRNHIVITVEDIAKIIGYTNHTTVLNAIKKWHSLGNYRDVMYLTRGVRKAFPIPGDPLSVDPEPIELDDDEYIMCGEMADYMNLTDAQASRVAKLLDIDRKFKYEYMMNVNGRSDLYVYNKKQILNRYGLCQ